MNGVFACRVSHEVSVFSSLLAGVTEMVSRVSEGSEQKNAMRETGGNVGKKKSPVEASEKILPSKYT
jgi:hypothetical protein